MVFVPEITTVNQHLQLGPETTIGTGVPATKEILCFSVDLAPEGDTVLYRGTGWKYDSEAEQNTEWSSAAWTGNMDYNGIIYPLVSIGGAVTAATHLASATAKDWIITPPITGSVAPTTFT